MRLGKDKKSIDVNDSLTLAAIPPEVFDYRLGNRSAIEWVIDQYRVKEDKRTGIRSDPNNPDDPEYIVRLVGQVVRVSVETVKIVAGPPAALRAGPGGTILCRLSRTECPIHRAAMGGVTMIGRR